MTQHDLPPPVLVRDFRPEDFPRLYQIDRICFPPDVAYSQSELLFYLKHPDSVTRVAELDETLIGFAVGRIDKERVAHILTLDVAPEARRRKVGTALMEALHEEFEKRNVAVTFLEVDAENNGAQRFYQGLRYVRVGTLRRYYSSRRDALRMARIPAGKGQPS